MFKKNKPAIIMVLTSFLLLLIGTLVISVPSRPAATKVAASPKIIKNDVPPEQTQLKSVIPTPVPVNPTKAAITGVNTANAPAKSTPAPAVKKVAVAANTTPAKVTPTPVRDTKPAATTPSRGGERTVTMLATAYDPGPGSNGQWAGISYLGDPLEYGIVAVDPNVIPLGSHLYIEGYGEGYAADTGGAIKGNRIDLCFNTYNEAMDFGMKYVKVTILD